MAYEGTIFDRLYGITHFTKYTDIKNATVLDIGCSAGLISYEFAKEGVRLIHGFDRIVQEITIANDIMEHTGIEYDFQPIDLCNGTKEIKHMFGKKFQKKYDIVLFLGMYHHLEKQLSHEKLNRLLVWIKSKAKTYLLIRTQHFSEIESVLKPDFKMTSRYMAFKKIGEMRVYKRCSAL